jgi:hypothetical protein
LPRWQWPEPWEGDVAVLERGGGRGCP